MRMTGSRQLDASQQEVWVKLNDVEVLKRCIPGCESLEQVDPRHLKAVVAVRIGPMSARFNGDVALSDINPPNGYRISGKGSGGVAGNASGGADVRLEPKDGGTLLSYDVDANVSGKLAQLGSRLIDATAAKLAEEFFTRFAGEVSPPEAGLPGPSEAGHPVHGAGAGRLSPMVYGAVIVVLAVIAAAVYMAG